MSAARSTDTLNFGKGLKVKRNVFGVRKSGRELWAIMRLYVKTRGKNRFMRIADTLRGVENKLVKLGAVAIPKYIYESTIALDTRPAPQIANPNEFSSEPAKADKETVYRMALHTVLLDFPFGNSSNQGQDEHDEAEGGKTSRFGKSKKKDDTLLGKEDASMSDVPFSLSQDTLRCKITTQVIADFKRRVKGDLYHAHKIAKPTVEQEILTKCLTWFYDTILVKAAHGLEGRRFYDVIKAWMRKVKDLTPKNKERKQCKKFSYAYFDQLLIEVSEGQNKIDRTVSENLMWMASGTIEPTNLTEWVRCILHQPILEHRRAVEEVRKTVLSTAVEELGKRVHSLQTSASRASTFASPEDFSAYLQNETAKYQELHKHFSEILAEREREAEERAREEAEQQRKARNKKKQEEEEKRLLLEQNQEQARLEAEKSKYPPNCRLKLTIEKLSGIEMLPGSQPFQFYCSMEVNIGENEQRTEGISDPGNNWWNAEFDLYGTPTERLKLTMWKELGGNDKPDFMGVAYVNTADVVNDLAIDHQTTASLSLKLAKVDSTEEERKTTLHISLEVQQLRYTPNVTASMAALAIAEDEEDEAQPTMSLPRHRGSVHPSAPMSLSHNSTETYKLLMQACLQFDTNMHLDQAGEMTFSRLSEALLYTFSLRWGISEATRSLMYVEYLIPKYMMSEIAFQPLYQAFQALAEGEQQRSFICTKEETQRLLHIITYLEQVLHYKTLHYRETFPCNTPAKELDQVLMMMSTIYAHPLLRKDNPETRPWKSELAILVKSGALSRFQTLSTLANAAPADESTHLMELLTAISTEFDSESKNFAKSFLRHEVDNVSLAIGTYLNFFKLEVEQYAGICVSPAGTQTPANDRGAAFAVYDRTKAFIEQIDEYESLKQKIDVPRWFSPFVYKFLHATHDKATMVVRNAVKLDDFQPVSDAVLHSSSVIDMFAFFHQTYDLLTRLKWPSQYQYAKFIYQMTKTFCLCNSIFVEEIQKTLSECQGIIALKGRETPINLIEFAMNYANRNVTDEEDEDEKAAIYEKAIAISKKYCIKLNDIEVARAQLNDLQDSMQIDELQDALSSNKSTEPISPLSPAPNTGLSGNFELRIMTAEGLMAADSGGLSNPYVVIKYDGQPIELCRSRVKNQLLNPVWGEAFDIGFRGFEQLVIEVYHRRPIMGDQLIGKAALDLFDEHGNFDTHDLALDLQPQGKILLRLKKVGDKDNDIEFQFRRCFRALKRVLADLFSVFVDPMVPIINSHISKIVATYEKRPVRESFFRTGFVSNQNLNIIDNELANELSDLFTWLGDQLGLLSSSLYEDILKNMLKKLWRETLLCIERLLIPSVGRVESNRRPLTLKQITVLLNVMEMIKMFLYGDGDLVSLSHLETSDYQRVNHIIELYQDSSDDLMQLYLKHVNPKGISISRSGSVTSTFSGIGGSGLGSMATSRSPSGDMSESFLPEFERRRSLGREWRAKSKTAGGGNYEYVLNILKLRGPTENTFVEEQLEQRWERVTLRAHAA